MRGFMIRFFRIPTLICTFALLIRLQSNAAEPGSGAAAPAADAPQHQSVLTGQAAFTDALHEAPGVRRHLTVADLPGPAPEQSVDNGPTVVARPGSAWPIAPKGFK